MVQDPNPAVESTQDSPPSRTRLETKFFMSKKLDYFLDYCITHKFSLKNLLKIDSPPSDTIGKKFHMSKKPHHFEFFL